jgi:hypothetical protein
MVGEAGLLSVETLHNMLPRHDVITAVKMSTISGRDSVNSCLRLPTFRRKVSFPSSVLVYSEKIICFNIGNTVSAVSFQQIKYMLYLDAVNMTAIDLYHSRRALIKLIACVLVG